MLHPVPQHLNSLNLVEISQALANVEHFIFFGTLLGIARDGDIILNDDDIDIYVDINLKKDLIQALTEYGFNVDDKIWPNLSNYFLQLQIERENILTYVDFYFFEQPHPNFIIDKWNFSGDIDNPYNAMHVPKNLIFPLKKYIYKNNEISIPAYPEQLCSFLYGRGWKIPLKKGKQYFTLIIKNRPVIVKGFFGKLLFLITKPYQRMKGRLYRFFNFS
tara:strand:+ start:2718 stop:3371 length:654 start_codon:yes stop_codon:yes gene_type:complete